MIRTHDEFETALEAASRLLATRPAEGADEHHRLMGLMQDIARYKPALLPPEPAQADSRSEQLARRLDAFEASLPKHLDHHWRSMVGGDLSGRAARED